MNPGEPHDRKTNSYFSHDSLAQLISFANTRARVCSRSAGSSALVPFILCLEASGWSRHGLLTAEEQGASAKTCASVCIPAANIRVAKQLPWMSHSQGTRQVDVVTEGGDTEVPGKGCEYGGGCRTGRIECLK